ncbi:hypothetical protein H5410_052194 [Solanum commersonii]|uniref:Uncharacterized protein n=1 Tax=Solanum commersonii TaxID=4109 RepID=A0A9J5X1J3_SOLCO|nr:hypothetical protein H5410_052194 [Solanum commersonii]
MNVTNLDEDEEMKDEVVYLSFPSKSQKQLQMQRAFIEVVGQYGPRMKPPVFHGISVNYLNKEVEETKKLWRINGKMEQVHMFHYVG